MSDFVLPANLVNDELKVTYASRFLMPISSPICIPIKRIVFCYIVGTWLS